MIEPGRRAGRQAYRGAVGIAILASFLTVWTTIVRDDGEGGGSFMLLLAVLVGWFAAAFRPAGMARTRLGVAVMQVLLGLLIATAPAVAMTPDGSLRALVFSGVFAALWLVSAALFSFASKHEREAVCGDRVRD